jgi:hypothetical protein
VEDAGAMSTRERARDVAEPAELACDWNAIVAYIGEQRHPVH